MKRPKRFPAVLAMLFWLGALSIVLERALFVWGGFSAFQGIMLAAMLPGIFWQAFTLPFRIQHSLIRHQSGLLLALKSCIFFLAAVGTLGLELSPIFKGYWLVIVMLAPYFIPFFAGMFYYHKKQK